MGERERRIEDNWKCRKQVSRSREKKRVKSKSKEVENGKIDESDGR